jgi:hypothetical protein
MTKVRGFYGTFVHKRRDCSKLLSSNQTFEQGVGEENKWEFPRHHLRILGILGEGCFGQVWKCEALNVAGAFPHHLFVDK